MIDPAGLTRDTDLWRLHPRGEEYLALGGDEIAPPRHVGVVVTDKCNLRCTICADQAALNATGTPRSHMPLDVFRAVAETVFPMVCDVELNSEGDPLFYPFINEALELVARHGARLRLQTNGTLLGEAVIDRLVAQPAIISLSIDATGALFERVRVNAVWSRVDAAIRALAARRKAASQTLMLYPTVTATTVGAMLDVARWAAELGIDVVDFHSYYPFPGGTEAAPDPDRLQAAIDQVADWAAATAAHPSISFDARPIHPGDGRHIWPSGPKARFSMGAPAFPLADGAPGADPGSLCTAPLVTTQIGMGGEVAACCRSSRHPLGFATSVEAFADAWLGPRMRSLRSALTRGSTAPLPLADCVGCIAHYLPGRAPRAATPMAPWQGREWRLLWVGRFAREGLAAWAKLPVGIELDAYELVEDGRVLGPGGQAAEAIAGLGGGRYGVDDGRLVFSASDGSDPARNGRSYSLRRIR